MMWSCLGGNECVSAKFHGTYEKVCGDLGVWLAPEKDKEKCFAATQEGVILGIMYSMKLWTWMFSEKKARKLLEAIAEVMSNPKVSWTVWWGGSTSITRCKFSIFNLKF